MRLIILTTAGGIIIIPVLNILNLASKLHLHEIIISYEKHKKTYKIMQRWLQSKEKYYF